MNYHQSSTRILVFKPDLILPSFCDFFFLHSLSAIFVPWYLPLPNTAWQLPILFWQYLWLENIPTLGFCSCHIRSLTHFWQLETTDTSPSIPLWQSPEWLKLLSTVASPASLLNECTSICLVLACPVNGSFGSSLPWITRPLSMGHLERLREERPLLQWIRGHYVLFSGGCSLIWNHWSKVDWHLSPLIHGLCDTKCQTGCLWSWSRATGLAWACVFSSVCKRMDRVTSVLLKSFDQSIKISLIVEDRAPDPAASLMS